MICIIISADPNPPDPRAPFKGSFGVHQIDEIVVHGESIQDAIRRIADAIDDHGFPGNTKDEDPEQALQDADDAEAQLDIDHHDGVHASILALERDGHFSPNKSFSA